MKNSISHLQTSQVFQLGCLIAVLLATAASGEQRTPYTESELETALPMGIPGVRTWADAPLSKLSAQVQGLPSYGSGRATFILALSGGGEHGAFGAGLLNGWSQSGRRPTFDIVTGVSTGALMAPFAFLGSGYDQRLKAVYTEMSMHSVVRGNPLLGLFGEGLYSTKPLQNVVARQVDQKLLEDIAIAYHQGRRLFVVTTNLDAQRAVLWNMGAIAASGYPAALDLFRKVLVASASVPGVFDPIFIDAQSHGRWFKEMHVDGGTAYPLFAVPLRLLAAAGPSVDHRRGQLYIVINNNLEPEFLLTKAKTLSITARAFNTLVKSDFYDTILGSYLFAKKEGFEFNLAYIPNAFRAKSIGLVDQKYMLSLFAFGETRGRLGGEWEYLPPHLYR